MNFDYMPELGWLFGYPFAIALMLFVSLTLYLIFQVARLAVGLLRGRTQRHRRVAPAAGHRVLVADEAFG
jgi:uncharacterized membrane protein